MAESPIPSVSREVECPPTPDLDSCPASPKIATNLTFSSDSEASVEGSSNEKCVICLCKCTNKSYTENCLHQFCFDCLKKWSRVKVSHLARFIFSFTLIMIFYCFRLNVHYVNNHSNQLFIMLSH